MKMDLLCFSHLRWNFVYQRPQHLLSRFAKQYRVFVIEEPMMDSNNAYNEIIFNEEADLWVVVPHLPEGLSTEQQIKTQAALLDNMLAQKNIHNYICWYYSPLALQFSEHLSPALLIYDCMDELSAFKFAPPALKQTEAKLFAKADLVFTGGHHLYEAKKDLHHNIYPFPSSIDKKHFEKARTYKEEPHDQKNIPHPRLGFYGVVDERFDTDLLGKMAGMQPGWHFVIIGPVVKIDPATLPKNENIHYLGGKQYKELPKYLASWDIAIMPFALNESTKYISPTKTPEYLSGGKPVISTSIRDVVKPYHDNDLVFIADTAEEFITAGEAILANQEYDSWLEKVDSFLADNSWDNTWQKMQDLITATQNKKKHRAA